MAQGPIVCAAIREPPAWRDCFARDDGVLIWAGPGINGKDPTAIRRLRRVIAPPIFRRCLE
jgi:hypothetical protein